MQREFFFQIGFVWIDEIRFVYLVLFIWWNFILFDQTWSDSRQLFWLENDTVAAPLNEQKTYAATNECDSSYSSLRT